MAKRCFELVEISANGQQFKSQVFLQNYQTALFLSLLEKRLLTQWQFDRCIEELQKQTVPG